jgi:hypothetical protein
MIGHRCKRCLWWDNNHIRIQHIEKVEYIPDPGICRKHKPGAININNTFIGVQPITDGEDFCGEFREDK